VTKTSNATAAKPCRPEHHALGPTLVAATAALVCGLVAAVGYDDLALWLYADWLARACHIVVGATAIARGIHHRRWLGLAGGVLVLVQFPVVGYLTIPGTSSGTGLLSGWAVAEAVALLGAVLITLDVGWRVLRHGFDVFLALGAALAGLIPVAVALGDGDSSPVASVLVYGGLVVALLRRRAALKREEPLPAGPGPSDQELVETALRGFALFKKGLIVLTVLPVAMFFLGSALDASEDLGPVPIALDLWWVAGWVLLLVGCRQMTRLPKRSGAASHLLAGHVILSLVGAGGVFLMVVQIMTALDPGLKPVGPGVLVFDLVLTVLLGLLVLSEGLRALALWLKDTASLDAARFTRRWLASTLGVLLFLTGLAFARQRGLSGFMMLLWFAGFITALRGFFTAFEALREALSQTMWVSAFGDDPEPPERDAVGAEEPA